MEMIEEVTKEIQAQLSKASIKAKAVDFIEAKAVKNELFKAVKSIPLVVQALCCIETN